MIKQVKASNPSAGGRQYHLHTKLGDIAPHCLLVGPPERARYIGTKLMNNGKMKAHHRGLKTYTGEFNGLPISVVTVGMGGPAMGIVLKEAVASGARTLIRVGSCSTLLEHAKVGELAICSGAVRLDGASQNWAMPEYPAMADLDVTLALRESARRLAHPFHLGIGATTACFDEGQARPDPVDHYLAPHIRAQHEALIRLRVTIYEMENSAMFVRADSLRERPRVGAICAIFGNRITNDFGKAGEDPAARVALDALCQLGQ